MTAPLELIRTIELSGGRFMIDGVRLGVVPKDAAAPVLEELVEHKQAIIELLSVRQQLPAGVRLIRWEPKQPPIQLSRSETVVGTVKFVSTTLAQLDAELNGHHWQAGNWTVEGLLARLEAVGCIVAVE